MATSYNKLYKLLIDKGMKKGELCRLSGVSKASVAKLGTGQSVSVGLLEKICRALDCDYGDIMEYIPDAPKEENE
jgi:DNA-binding Xre family transcriptional regulator